MLIDWGTAKADAAKLDSFVNGSMQGKALYMKCGFETVGVTTLDLKPFGVNGISKSYAMVRPARVSVEDERSSSTESEEGAKLCGEKQDRPNERLP